MLLPMLGMHELVFSGRKIDNDDETSSCILDKKGTSVFLQMLSGHCQASSCPPFASMADKTDVPRRILKEAAAYRELW